MTIEKTQLNDLRELEQKVLEVLYTRHLCHDLGIDYNNPQKEDFDKARKYLLTIYEVKHE